MAFYENTIVAKQDLAEKEIKSLKEKYNEIINKSSGKVVKIEEWGLLNLFIKKVFIFTLNLKEIKRHLIKSIKKLKLIHQLLDI